MQELPYDRYTDIIQMTSGQKSMHLKTALHPEFRLLQKKRDL